MNYYLCAKIFGMTKEKFDCEQVLPYGNRGGVKRIQIARMFDAISQRYDLFNRLMSLGIDRSWRRRALQRLVADCPQEILDVATGTGDFALQACLTLRPKGVVGIDISEGMLRVGREKAQRQGLPVRFEVQDGEQLTFADGSFDAVTIAFGIRNFEHLTVGVREMHRVLKPGGSLVILELSEPEHFPMKQAYRFYSNVLIPLLGRLFSSDKNAYRYLPQSIKAFPKRQEMRELLFACGFSQVEASAFTFGVCSFYLAKK